MFPRFTVYFPDFFPVKSIFINSYSICAIAGMAAGIPIAVFSYKKRAKEWWDIFPVLVCAALGALFGMHVLYGLTNISSWNTLFTAPNFYEFLRRAGKIFGGSVFYGGLFGAIIAGGLCAKLKKLPLKDVTDVCAPMAAIFHGFARIGCFLGGCCYGIEWEHGITFENSLVESANGVARVPVQLFEAGFEFALGIFLWVLLNKQKFYGKLFAVYLFVYSVGRFLLEFLRGDEYRGFIFGLSTSQFISVFVFAGTLAFFVKSFSKSRKKA